jgi:hypothetical protein
MEAGTCPPPEEAGTPYAGAAVAGAVLATLFFPIIALIAAALLQGAQADPRKRSQLRTWAWASGGLLLLEPVLILLAVGAFASSKPGGVDRSGPCVGGPRIGATVKSVPGHPHKFVEPCAISGTDTVTLP